MITAFFVGFYIGGAVVDATTGLFIGESKTEAAMGAAVWPVNVVKLAVTAFRNR